MTDLPKTKHTPVDELIWVGPNNQLSNTPVKGWRLFMDVAKYNRRLWEDTQAIRKGDQ